MFVIATTATILPAVSLRAGGIMVRDASGHDVTVGDPSRIVAIGGAVTEILYALGLENHVVGVDSTSLYPAAALKMPNVGYMRQLSSEGVLGLNPSVIFAMQGSGPKETLDVLQAANVPLVLVPETYSEQGILDKISLVGHALGADTRAACLTAAVAHDLAQLKALRAKVEKPVRVMFVMSLVNGRAMAAGRHTAADEIIKLSGGVNAISEYEGYKPINDEAIVAAKPDVVLSIDRGKDSLSADAIYQHPAFALTPAAANRSFMSMEGLYLLGFGPRTAAAARDLSVRLYPALASEAEKFTPAAPTVDCLK
ncbi:MULTISPECIES: hemin ABC transporter substrate-binding protein [unclassified Nitrobacter]|uniref:heme/hemin ABC transporter substrate-binding protein n=1 Tax=unclassified Nitrobacter TaxID=2620411 RepID=UPI0009283A64|nr:MULTISPECIES: hemin ABC transporter substrate-binding protein [unclassified Nitrobacter]OJV00753.1 MAG: hemin ABC transporter substrate-binding protein [Nitrobacter sp. 62-23]